jgi:hypothetical protein
MSKCSFKYHHSISRAVVLSVLFCMILGQAFAFANTTSTQSKQQHYSQTSKKATPIGLFLFESLEQEVDGDDDSDQDLTSLAILQATHSIIFNTRFSLCLHVPSIQIQLHESESRRYILFHSLKIDC